MSVNRTRSPGYAKPGTAGARESCLLGCLWIEGLYCSYMTDDVRCFVREFGGKYTAADFGGVFVIGFAGLRGSGKSTVAQAFCEELCSEGVAVTQMAFADRLKDVVTVLVGSDQWEKEDVLYGGSDWDVREFLMRFATEFVRDTLGEDFWVDVVAQRVLECGSPVVVIDDMRFPNEYAFVRALGIGVLIERGVASKEYEGVHRSEMPDALGITGVVLNDGSVSDAVHGVRKIVSRHPRCCF